MAKDTKLYLECACGSPDHLTSYSLYDWGPEEEPELLVMVQASDYRPWYRRLGVGLKYIFGFEPLQWHDVLVKPEDAGKLLTMLKEFKRLNDVYVKGRKDG